MKRKIRMTILTYKENYFKISKERKEDNRRKERMNEIEKRKKKNGVFEIKHTYIKICKMTTTKRKNINQMKINE